MNELLLKKLNEEQSKVLSSSQKYIVVSACPGSGKTHTLVKLVKQELEFIKEYQGIVACSFTNESANEIKERIGEKYNLDNSFIGTIDGFVKYLISLYVNRTHKFPQRVVIGNKIDFPKKVPTFDGKKFLKTESPGILVSTDDCTNGYDSKKLVTINDITKFYDKFNAYKELGVRYCKEKWIKKLEDSIYEVSFPSYFFAVKVAKLALFKDWFANHFTTIYIDEAQDLNYFQHLFFNELKKNTDVRIIMLGDPNQSIYQFRGARPELFTRLTSSGYIKYSLSYSCRCNPNVIAIANRIYNRREELKEKCVWQIESIDLDFLKSLKGGTFILTDTNPDASRLYNDFNRDGYDIVFEKRFDFENEYDDYTQNSLIVDELIKYYFNFDNPEDRFKYPFRKIEQILGNLNISVKKADFDLSKYSNLKDFLEMANSKIDIGLSDSTIQKIVQLLMIDEYKHYYFQERHLNKIMTIHTSKGLENDNVVIYLTNQYDKPTTAEFKNKLFVAITRAKSNVYILSFNNDSVKSYISKLLDN